MMKLIIITISLIFGTFVTSCMREDIAVKPYPRGDLKYQIIPMTPDYSNQFYFSFEKGIIVKENPYDIWDIAFQCNGEGNFVLLNGAKFMEAADMGKVDFYSVKDRIDAKFGYDSTNGDFENYAIGKWWSQSEDSVISNNHVYIINRGKDRTSKRVGFVKLQFLNSDTNSYIIKYSNLDGSNEFTKVITKNQEVNYIMFSFSEGGITYEFEPKKEDWDIQFTKFIGFLPYENELLPYGVTGVILNHTSVSAAIDSISTFEDINLQISDKYNFSNSPGIIGHEWKNFDLNGEVYSAKIFMNYLLKDSKGFIWKFRFLDFLNDDGLRGYPKFEYIRL